MPLKLSVNLPINYQLYNPISSLYITSHYSPTPELMRFPPEFIDRLRNYLPISEVVGKRVPIKRHGREYHALCPFHKEKSPSFTVNDEKGFFHCFGCGAHGDAIGFIKDFERVEYREAVEKLAGEGGLEVPQMTREAEAAERKRHTLED